MKIKNIKQKILAVLTFVSAALPLVIGGAPVSAWGPERPTYTVHDPAHHATFNSITDNPAVGDERDFVRVAEIRDDGSSVYGNEITIEPNKRYSVYIYFHNDASATFNDDAHGNAGLAWNTRLSSNFPDSLAKGERGTITGRITSTSTSPAAVWDEAHVTASEAMTLHFVLGSATIHVDPRWETNGKVLSSANLFSSTGTFLGLTGFNGLIPGCDEYSGQVVYTFSTKAVEKPDEPDPEPEPEPEPTPDEPTPEPTPDEPKPETPQELPETGPAEVALAAVIVIAVVAGFVYWRKTSHAVKKVTRSAKGRGGKRK